MHFNQLFIYHYCCKSERVSERILQKGKNNATVEQLSVATHQTCVGNENESKRFTILVIQITKNC